MLWTIFLLINGLLALVLLFYSSRSRRRNEPPLDKGLVPWLGHALEFGKDAAKFLTRMKNKHGDIFTVRVAGQYVTVLLDPASYDQVLNDSVSLDFSANRARLMERIFGLELPGVDPAAQTAWMRRHFNGVNLAKLSTSMGSHLEALLLAERRGCEPSEWRQEGLFSLCYSLLFRAGYLTLFERSSNATDVYKEFRKFDALLSKMARGTLRTAEKKMASSSREHLWELLSPAWLRSGGPGGPSERSEGPGGPSERGEGPGGPGGPSEPTSGSWQQGYQQYLQEEKVDLEMQRRALLLQLWTTQGNAGPCAFWLLGFLLTQPQAMRAVRAEITEILAGRGAPKHQPTTTTPSTPSTLQGAPTTTTTTTSSPLYTLLDTHCTPVLDSVLRETLRLTAAAIISRQAVQSKVLRTSDGREYHVRPGDKICLFPFLSPQTDPGIHHQPQDFQYDRFLNADKTEKKTFYKDGERLKYYSMPWGGGSNVCVGKQFATRGIKQFVLTVLTRLDVELCDPQARVPPIDPSRYGYGMLQPIGDLQVRYRLKTTLNHTVTL